jgi:HEPN domain-containing protein
MYCLQDAEFVDTKTSGSTFSFKSVGTACPHCGRSSWFEFDSHVSRDDINKAPRSVNCPGCRQVVRFFVISLPRTNETGWLWADPSPKTEHLHRGDIAAALGAIDPALKEAYDEATMTLASGHASSATIQARRTLEGLVKHLLHDINGQIPLRRPLDQLIRTLSEHLDLATPLTDTAHAVREGGNLGAHYDAEITASKELASKTVDLLEAIADYLLVLPRKVGDLRALLEREPTQESTNSDTSQ